MRERNFEARCVTCPWWEREGRRDSGLCKGTPKYEVKMEYQACSLHPEAYLEAPHETA